jgi:hypothetical protein
MVPGGAPPVGGAPCAAQGLQVEMPAGALPGGIYLCRLVAGAQSATTQSGRRPQAPTRSFAALARYFLSVLAALASGALVSVAAAVIVT